MLSAVCMAVFSVPATPELLTITQPDGSTVQVYMVGDEFGYYYRAQDGTPMLRNHSGYLEIDKRAPEAIHRTRAARIKAHNAGAGQSVFPTIGSPHSLVILVGYKDVPFEQSRADFEALLNEQGYAYNDATGSCRDYFTASSNGQFTPIFDVFGPYTLQNNRAFYGAETERAHDANPGSMVAEACQLAAASGVDFSNYDTNGDGLLDNVFIYYAGHNQAEGGPEESVWPHQSDISYRGIRLNGVLVGSYACTSEYRGSYGNVRCGIGTFCHEFGHVIGLPDFYDTGYNYYSVGSWDIMCSGSYNNLGRTPPTYTAYERFYEGWLTPVQLTTPGAYALSPIETSNQAYLIAAEPHNLKGTQPNPAEFFMLEYRDGKGWDMGLPGHGMLVWHIDYSPTAWTANTPNNGINGVMRMHLEEANGVPWSKRSLGESGRSSDPYPGTTNVTAFTPKLHNGTTLNYPVFEISEHSGLINITFIRSGSSNITVDKSALAFETTLDDSKKIVGWTPQAITIMGSGLNPESPVSLIVNNSSRNGAYYLYAGDTYPDRTSKLWTSSINLPVQADSTMMHTVWISFVPAGNLKHFLCNEDQAANGTLTIRGEGSMNSLLLTGLAPRASEITTPVTDEPTAVTPNSFRLTWQPVSSAEKYYLSLYSKQPGSSEVVQSFEDFNSMEQISLQGWQSSTTLTTSSAKADGVRALHLKDYGDYIVTENYPVAVNAISYWVNAMATDADTVGYIELEAYDGLSWKKLTETILTHRTKNKTVEHSFDAEAGYTRFRLVFYGRTSNGVALDAFTATLSRKIEYIYRGDELEVNAPHTAYTFADLTPGTTYCYRLRCTDLSMTYYGGCNDNLSDYSLLGEVTTVDIPEAMNDDRHLALTVDSINYDSKTQIVYVTSPKNGDALYIYDWRGALVHSIPVINDVYAYPLPGERFVAGTVYTIKYVEADKLRRKQRFIKTIFNR